MTGSDAEREIAMVKIVGCALIACLGSGAIAVAAPDAPDYKPGPWHYRSVSCVDTTVKSVTPRLVSAGQTSYAKKDFEQSGVEVGFNTRLGADPAAPSAFVGVSHYQGDAGNSIMIAEHPGDRVQVCIVHVPAPTKYCNPDTDWRGRVYRVWDYRQNAQYSGLNSEHDCGGA
jgi:hypothetical protein